MRTPEVFHASEACPKCGVEKRRYMLIDMSDDDADEFPLIPVCVRCKHRFPADDQSRARTPESHE